MFESDQIGTDSVGTNYAVVRSQNTMANPFVILTGASGVGKTTIARTVIKLHPEISVFLDEELERPTDEFMKGIGPTEGPGGPFQRGFALYSVPKLAKDQKEGQPILLDCQCRIAFLQEAITTARISDARIVLVECDDQTRDARLNGRGSPELAHEQMRSSSKYLHREAVEAGLDILDTGAGTIDENVAHVLDYLLWMHNPGLAL